MPAEDTNHIEVNYSKYTRRDAVHQKAPFARIRLLDAVQQSKRRVLQLCGLSLVSSAPKKWRLTRWSIDPLTFAKKNPSRAIPRSTYIQPPSLAKIRQRTSEEIGNKHTNKRCSNYSMTRKYYPSSKQFRDPPTYTHQPAMQQKVPFSLIRCSSSKVAFCSCVEWGWHIYNIVESESDPLTRRAVDLFEKEPLKGYSEVHLHTPTKFGEDRSKDLGGDREQTDRQTNRQTLLDL